MKNYQRAYVCFAFVSHAKLELPVWKNSNKMVPNWRLIAHKLNMMILTTKWWVHHFNKPPFEWMMAPTQFYICHFIFIIFRFSSSMCICTPQIYVYLLSRQQKKFFARFVAFVSFFELFFYLIFLLVCKGFAGLSFSVRYFSLWHST